MKSKFKILLSFGLLLIAASVTLATDNAVMGLTAASIVGAGVQHFTGISLIEVQGLHSAIALTGIKRVPQRMTIGGSKRLYIVFCDDLATEFLNYELAKTAGEFAGAIPLIAGKKFIEVEAWYDSTKFETEMKTGAGFTQGLEFKVLGYNKDIVKFSALIYEMPLNFIVQGNDDALYYIGMKYIPIMLDMKGILPEKGSARKEATFTGKNDGLPIPIFPLGSAVTFAVDPLAGTEIPVVVS